MTEWPSPVFEYDPIYDPLIPQFVQFIGREQEQDALRNRLCSQKGERVALNG